MALSVRDDCGFITNGGNRRYLKWWCAVLDLLSVNLATQVLCADPVLTLVDGNGNVVQTNNNWKNTQQEQRFKRLDLRRPMNWRRRSSQQSSLETILLFFRVTLMRLE